MHETSHALIQRKQSQYGDRFDGSDLDQRFARYYTSGERIRIKTCGMLLAGTVGITTGWKPTFLLMRTARSIGSLWTLGPRDEIVAVKRGRYYVPIS